MPCGGCWRCASLLSVFLCFAARCRLQEAKVKQKQLKRRAMGLDGA
jgi:hypothetical protein